MDFEFEYKWKATIEIASERFDEQLDLQAILFLIGVQEFGLSQKRFSKSEKVDLMHVAICSLLEPYGYYTSAGRDADGWPHFTKNYELPFLEPKEQELLVKKAIIEYFGYSG